MGKGIKEDARAQQREPISLSELIHQHVRAAIETAVYEELRAALGASPYERIDVRQGYRNGVRERTLTGPTGPVALTLPRATLFSGTGHAKEWTSRIVPRYQRRMPEVNEAVVATYLAGGNTRRIRGALQPLLKAAPLSTSAVSRVVATLKDGLEAWRTRSLADLDVIYVYLDGFALRVRSSRQHFWADGRHPPPRSTARPPTWDWHGSPRRSAAGHSAATQVSGATDDPMTLRELLETVKCFGAKIALHDGDSLTIEPPDVLTPAVREAVSEHHAALVALIRSRPSSTSSFDNLLTALDGLEEQPPADVLHARLRTLAAGLVGADPLVRELVRGEAIARLNALRVRTPARLVDAALTARLSRPGGAGSDRDLLFADPDPWPEAVNGAALLDELAHTYRRFVSLPDGGAEALALWIVFTYALGAFDVAPILALCSPLKRCGKTTTEDLTASLAKRPLAAANITVAALYRTVEHFAPTLIVDEADTFLLTNLALRGVINSGHTRATAFVVRTTGHEPRLFSTWGARMIALIGRLPATLEDRAIVLPMHRRAPGETVEEHNGMAVIIDAITVRWLRMAVIHQESRDDDPVLLKHRAAVRRKIVGSNPRDLRHQFLLRQTNMIIGSEHQFHAASDIGDTLRSPDLERHAPARARW